MRDLLNASSQLEEWMPPLARVLRTLFRAARAMEAVAGTARAGDVPAADLAAAIVGRASGREGERQAPGLAQVRKAWRECVDGASPSRDWLGYAAWAVARASDGELTPTPNAIGAYLVGVRDACGALKLAIDQEAAMLYPARQVGPDGEAIDPVLPPSESASLVAAIDTFVATIRGS